MKIKTWIKYEVPYLPPRCRKTRYREEEAFVDINLREVEFSKLVLAYEDKSFEGKGKIYRYGGKLWAKVKMPNLPEDELNRMKIKKPLDWLVYHNGNHSTYFSSRFPDGEEYTRESMIARAKKDMAKLILVNGELYERTVKPEYHVMTFGCGNGDGTALFVGYPARRDCGWWFAAEKGKEAVEFQKKKARERRDFNCIGLYKPCIICY